MNPLHIAGTESSPEIKFDPITSLLCISGESAPENARSIYLPVLEWLDEFKKSQPQVIKFIFSFDYLNSLSLKYVYDIIKKLEEISQSGCNLSITWDYMKDDDEMKENGEEFARLFDLDFKVSERK